MGLFNIIGRLLSDNAEEPLAHTDVEKNELTLGDVSELSEEDASAKESCNKEETKPESLIEHKEELVRALCELLAEYADDVLSCGNKKMSIWLDTDHLNFKTYDTLAFRQQLQGALLNELDVAILSVGFSMGKPPEELHCTPVGKSGKVFVQITDIEPVQAIVTRTAIVSVFGNSGSLLKDKYVLSSDEMKEKMIPAYNIGAGEFPQIPSGYRQNHIAIDDSPNSPMVEKNKFVSRMHAHIGYSEKYGFFLQVERDGTRLMGKRTRIFRGEQKIELDNPLVKEPLQSGDLIELGKAVVLRYVEQKD